MQTILIPVVLYGSEIWHLKQKQKLSVFENVIMKSTFVRIQVRAEG